MWIQLSDEQVQLLKEADWGNPARRQPAVDMLRERLDTFSAEAANDRRFIDALSLNESDFDMDDEPVTSASDDGAYVMCWAWVSNEDAGIDEDDEE